jgi:choline-sulfatase
MPDERPNVLFIMDDQHRYDYLGCAGADFLNTPNLDRLAERGVRFTQCTTNSPVCAPARIGLASGLQPTRLGALDNRAFLPFSTRTYYHRLRDAGYRVGCIGKLDLAKPDHYNGRYGDRPCVYGWGFTHPEECEGKMHAGNSPTPNGPYNFYLQEHGLFEKFHQDYKKRSAKGWNVGASWDSVLPTEHFEDAYIGRRAAEWIRTIPDDFPWHYFVSFVGPHDPFDPPTEYADLYRDVEMPPPIVESGEGKPDWVRSRMKDATPEQVAVTRRQYCGAIQLIDDQVGMMLDALDERGMLENTYVIFSSDHGEMLGDHGLYTKSVAYEASLRVPLIAAGPGVERGRVSDALVELIDVNPTICELAGLPPQENIDARSVGPVLRGEADGHREDAVSAITNFRTIRTDRYKLIDNYNAPNELYDLQEDPQELHNIAADRSEIVRDLRGRLHRRFLEGGNQR